MSADRVTRARDFVTTADLPAPLPLTQRAAATAPFDFDAARDQAAVVGSDVIAFATGVTRDQRNDVVNATMLAQLVAKKHVPEPTTLPQLVAWYDHYFDALSRIGFVMQDRGFAEYEAKGDTFEAHQAILDVASALLGASPSALALVKKTLDALQKASASSPWITLFDRESRSANTARFQVSLVSPDASAPFLVSILAFGLEAESTVTQVLFFKFSRNTVKLLHHSGKATIDAEVLAGVRDEVVARLRAFARDFFAGLDL